MMSALLIIIVQYRLWRFYFGSNCWKRVWYQFENAAALHFQNYRSAEEIVQDDEETDVTSKSDRPTLEMLQQQLEQTNRLCQTLMGDQTASQMARLSVSG